MSTDGPATGARWRELIPREFAWISLLVLIVVVGLGIGATWDHNLYLVDPGPYAARSRPLLEGSLPYIDYEFEHLPLAILPMAAAAVLEKMLPLHYTLIFWALMSGVLIGIGLATNRLGRLLGIEEAALRWVLISWALLPLITFRADAVSVLLAVLAVMFAVAGNERASAWSMGAAIAAKGWPVALAAVDWWRGRRRRAVFTVAATAAGAAVLLNLPLFRAGRDFYGVHLETVTGAAVGLVRLLRGLPTQTGLVAGAGYVEVGSWALAVNVVLGAALGLTGLSVLRRRFSWRAAIDLIGVLTIALMLASPLLSAQFIIWFTPFAALSTSRSVRLGAAATALLTGIFVTFFYLEATWWWALIVVRNGFLIWTGWVWVRHLLARPSKPTTTTSEPVAALVPTMDV